MGVGFALGLDRVFAEASGLGLGLGWSGGVGSAISILDNKACVKTLHGYTQCIRA